ncbi:MAG: methylenetetrahydrofolate reductase [NAD(P)H] [Proteobacteria bacterium]|nr:methylenetetrahydrofolate reductase [NAD(P)H] [Pseudomonadota bacterium]
MAYLAESLEHCFSRPLPQVSFEFFPPKTEKMEQTLWESIGVLAPIGPRFVSVTYGAGGSTRERTHATVRRIAAETDLVPAAHLTCVDASRAEIIEVVQSYAEAGVRHIVALRGDPPAGGKFSPHPDGFANAAELVSALRDAGDFEVSVAAHPETHPDAVNADADIDNLKRKLDAGATRAITQYFFEPATYLRFRDRAAAAGIDASLVPGVLPVTNFEQVVKFSEMCGATVPVWMSKLFGDLDGDPATRQLVAASVAVQMCHALRAEGVNEFHFYTLNRSQLTLAICRMLGLATVTPARAADVPLPAQAAT